MSNYVAKEISHLLFGVTVTVVVAVAGELTEIASFEEVSLAGLAVMGVRSFATAVIVVLTPHIITPNRRRL